MLWPTTKFPYPTNSKLVSWLSLVLTPVVLTFHAFVLCARLCGLCKPKALPNKDMRDHVVIITGCNTGIGKQTAIGLGKLGATVVMACRNQQRAEAAKQDIQKEVASSSARFPFAHKSSFDVVCVDLADFASVKQFCEEITTKYGARGVDVVVCNAGLNGKGQSKDGLNIVFQSNFLGHVAMVTLLLPLLRKRSAENRGEKSRVVMLGSVMHHFANPTLSAALVPGYTNAYCASKVAGMLFCEALNKREPHITSVCGNPGAVASDIWRRFSQTVQQLFNILLLSTKQGAATSIHLAVGELPSVEQTTKTAKSGVSASGIVYATPYYAPLGFVMPFELWGPFAGANVFVHPGLLGFVDSSKLLEQWWDAIESHSTIKFST